MAPTPPPYTQSGSVSGTHNIACLSKLMPRYHRTHKTIAFQTPDSVCRFALPCITIWSGFEIYLIYNYTQPTVGYHVLTAWAACILLIVRYFSGYERGEKMQSAILGKREHNYGK